MHLRLYIFDVKNKMQSTTNKRSVLAPKGTGLSQSNALRRCEPRWDSPPVVHLRCKKDGAQGSEACGVSFNLYAVPKGTEVVISIFICYQQKILLRIR